MESPEQRRCSARPSRDSASLLGVDMQLACQLESSFRAARYLGQLTIFQAFAVQAAVEKRSGSPIDKPIG